MSALINRFKARYHYQVYGAPAWKIALVTGVTALAVLLLGQVISVAVPVPASERPVQHEKPVLTANYASYNHRDGSTNFGQARRQSEHQFDYQHGKRVYYDSFGPKPGDNN